MKPITPKRVLHPALVARATAVKVAHAHLSKTSPGFTDLHPHDRARMVQQHIGRSGEGYLKHGPNAKKGGVC